MDAHVSQRYSKIDLFSINGRIGRNYYLFYSLVLSFILFLMAVYTFILAPANQLLFYTFSLVLLLLLFGITNLTIQRCHDFDKSGWYALLALIPFSVLMFYFIPSTNGLNRYGEVPEPAPKIILILNYLLILILGVSLAYLLLFHTNIPTIFV